MCQQTCLSTASYTSFSCVNLKTFTSSFCRRSNLDSKLNHVRKPHICKFNRRDFTSSGSNQNLSSPFFLPKSDFSFQNSTPISVKKTVQRSEICAHSNTASKLPGVFTAEEIAEAARGILRSTGDPGRICTDSRRLQPGDWFLALKGPSFDAHDFLPQVLQKGCAGAIGRVAPRDWPVGFVEVPDSLKALQSLGASARMNFRGPVVGITGSTGKTTSRAMTALALRSLGHVHQTEGNLNNHIGVPLTLLACPPGASALVLELGMNHAGEIAELAHICAPTVRLVLNVGPVHTEGLGSVEGVARAKGELFDTARPGDVCILNADDPLVARMPLPAGVSRVTFGTGSDCDVRLVKAESVDGGRSVMAVLASQEKTATIHLSAPGRHLATNACASVAVAVSLGIPLEVAARGLEQFAPVGMRLKLEEIPFGPLQPPIVLINDCYNANPISMRAALELLASFKPEGRGRRVAALGDMLELGPVGRAAHLNILELCSQLDISVLGFAGSQFLAAAGEFSEMHPEHNFSDSSKDLSMKLVPRLRGGDVVVVKGSRGMEMEVVCEAIREFKPAGFENEPVSAFKGPELS